MKRQTAVKLVLTNGLDIIRSSNMQSERRYMQHNSVSCYSHSLSVAVTSVRLAEMLRLKTDLRSMIRGALLHDYFLYDWHAEDGGAHRLHGYFHPRTALRNAKRDFLINDRESDIIAKHMFPLTLNPPRYRESVLVCLADKLCAMREIFKF